MRKYNRNPVSIPRFNRYSYITTIVVKAKNKYGNIRLLPIYCCKPIDSSANHRAYATHSS